ncbi:MAG: SpoIID/LytB domain-containing protein [Acidobacteria bacterium]|nr:SpoIID/LytB domain-containing protein [Acidobacteriota bacterium]
MRSSFTIKLLAFLVSTTLLVFALPLRAQETQAQENTRPRRAVLTQADETKDSPATGANTGGYPRLDSEPSIRIGLTSVARSVTVSTSGRLLDASDANAPPVPFEVSRVRLEPRAYPSAPTPTDDEDSYTDIAADQTTLPAASDRTDAATPTKKPPQPGARSNVRLVSRVNVATRGATLYVPGTTKPLLDIRAPITFASDDEALHPVRFNEKSYRGRLEVFPNTHGALTVVNVLGLEDYVRGVVPNELSPGGFPAIEALKAQAVAARTYAVSHTGQFSAEGFDLVPTTRSQVYGGLSTEHPLTDRAVAETRGIVATYDGQPINALYTSTCGGRTEDAENIFGGEAVPYLRARECAIDGKEALAPYVVRTSREQPNIQDAEHSTSARDAALLSTHGFQLPARMTDAWLSGAISLEEVRALVAQVAFLSRQAAPSLTTDATRPAGFVTSLASALDGESRGGVLLDKADVDYLLAFRDADEIPERNRADVAIFLRDGYLSLYTDATLRPRLPMPRARALRVVAHALEARGLFRLQKATTRPATDGALVLRPTGKGNDKTLNVSSGAFLFRAYGENIYAVRELRLVGGEAVTFHMNARGEVDYMEARPSPNGAASDRFSTYTNWTETLTPSVVLSRLARNAGGIGTLVDLRVRSRGASRRVTDLEIVGTTGTSHVRGGRVRSALALREQLFVIDRNYDETGRITSFVFTGRGWGHGVGMCQVGAYGLARSGWKYDRILKAYYSGISLTKLY